MKISVVVVTYNSSDAIGRCLESILAQPCGEIEIFVVDNGSFDATALLVRTHYPQVKLICNDRNVGAARARNQAIEQCSGEWVLTLDSDAALEKNFIGSFIQFLSGLKEGNRVGIVVPRILYPDAKTIYSMGHHLTFLRRFYDVGMGKKDRGQFGNLREVFGACSAMALYRREMLSKLKEDDGGVFDQEFFFMAEDVDLAWRAHKKGWKVCVCHDCLGYHTGNGSRLPQRQKHYYSIRNRFVMMFKNDDRGRLLLFLLPLFLYEVFRLSYLVLKGEGGLYVSALTSAWDILKKKREKR